MSFEAISKREVLFKFKMITKLSLGSIDSKMIFQCLKRSGLSQGAKKCLISDIKFYKINNFGSTSGPIVSIILFLV